MTQTWCVLVWMSASADLLDSAQHDIAEARSALRSLAPPGVHVVVCLNRDGDAVIQNLARDRPPPPSPGAPPTNPLPLHDFVSSQADLWNACDQRVLVLWGHGTVLLQTASTLSPLGTVEPPVSVVSAFTGASTLKPPTIVGYDACSMGSVEVGWRLGHIPDPTTGALPFTALITSQIPEPAKGWPYHKLVKALADDLDVPAPDLARNVVDIYADDVGVPDFSMSAFDPAEFGGVTKALSSLVDHLQTRPEGCPSVEDVLNAASQASLPNDALNVDLACFVRNLDLRVDLDGHAQAVSEALTRLVIHRRTGGSLTPMGGLSVRLPDGAGTQGHLLMEGGFADDAGWRRFWETCVLGREEALTIR